MYRYFLILCSMSVITGEKGNDQRIIGGENISIVDAPYQVSVYNAVYQRHMCGGSIISANYILTAAHCAYLSPQAYRIRVNSSERSQGGDLHNVIAIFKHEDYHLDGPVPLHDIALMRIVPPINVQANESLKAIALPEQHEQFTGMDAFLSGWGETAAGKASEHLQGLTVRVLAREVCDENYAQLFKGIRDGQICAEHSDRNKDLCNGDSGGPLVIDDKQIGLVSWSGPGCAVPHRPGVYTEVAAYRDWIDRHVKAS